MTGPHNINTPILSGINSPKDIWDLSLEELSELASELRKVILEVVSQNGGHLASNLGAVELTIALHYVFRAPTDKIIWDVGHQAYTHKLLTGRRDEFHTLRQKGGISGFPKRMESQYDHFDVGHSGTSISAALGIAKAMDHMNLPGKVVPVIGDGSMTAGLALEGLNQAGDMGSRLVVVLNDNEMSISPNVGAISSYLSRTLTGQTMQKIKKESENLLKSIPGIGSSMHKVAKRVEESFKTLIYPGILFEELGYQYIGPIRGHRLDRLIVAFTNARRIDGPVLVHVGTVKGYGYAPAEENPSIFHGIGPFELETGKSRVKAAPPSYTDLFAQALIDEAKKNEKIIAITAAMPEGTGLHKFAEAFPDRFYDVGIAEQHAVTFAAGLASMGFRPVVAIYSTFLQRAYDQIVHDVCLQDLPVVFAMDRGGLVGEDGPPHHGVFDLSYLRHIPNIVLMAPGDEDGLRKSLATALACDGPSALRYPRGSGVGIQMSDPQPWDLGKGELLREGTDIGIIAIGSVVHPALEAAKSLSEEGVEAAVVDARFIKPLDADLIKDVSETCGLVLTVEENSLMGGFGSAVLEVLSDAGERVKVSRLGIPDSYVEHGSPAELRADLGLDAQGIRKAVKEILDGGA